MVNEKLLMLRKTIRKRKPRFMRQEQDRRIKLFGRDKWRQPKGLHSKMRQKYGGRRHHPGTCFMVPKEVRGLSKTGLKMVPVKCLADISKLNPETDGAVLGPMGGRLRVEVLKKLIERKVAILNIRNPQEFIKSVEEKMAKKKEEKKAKDEKKRKSKEESLKKAEEKKKKEEKAEEKTAEEKQKEADEEKRKVLEARA